MVCLVALSTTVACATERATEDPASPKKIKVNETANDGTSGPGLDGGPGSDPETGEAPEQPPPSTKPEPGKKPVIVTTPDGKPTVKPKPVTTVITSDGGVVVTISDAGVDPDPGVAPDPDPDPEPLPVYFNVAGNSGAELGQSYWSINFTEGGDSLTRRTKGSQDPVLLPHTGLYAIKNSARKTAYDGPAYVIPSGEAIHDISVFAAQVSGESVDLDLHVSLNCGGITEFKQLDRISAKSGVWGELHGVVEVGADCTLARVFVSNGELADGSLADIYVDDLTVTPLYVVNLVGNHDVENPAGVVGGWSNFGNVIGVTSEYAHSGTQSIMAPRTEHWQGGSYRMPTGSGNYYLSVFVYHEHTAPLYLLLSVSCAGGAKEFNTPFGNSVKPGEWTELSTTWLHPSDCTGSDFYVNQPPDAAVIPTIYMDDLFIVPIPLSE